MAHRPPEPAHHLSVLLKTVSDALTRIREPSAPETETGVDRSDTATDHPKARRPEVLEEQVLDLLERRDGRIRQQDIVAETGYSEGRISRLLAGMEDDGQIIRYWKSGQKVVAHPDSVHETLLDAPEA